MEEVLFQVLVAASVGLIFGVLIYGPKFINKMLHQTRATKGNVKSKYYLAEDLADKKNYALAINYLTEVVNLSPNLYEPYKLLALCYYGNKQYDLAIPLFERLIKEDSNNAEYYFIAGNCYFKTNNSEKALEYQSKAIKINKKFNKMRYC